MSKGGGGAIGFMGGGGAAFGSLLGNGNPFDMSKNGIGDLSGSNKQAKIAQQMAEAEQQARMAVTKEARAGADRMRLAAQSPQQLQALDAGLKAAQTQVDFDLKQLAAVDPAIMEASKQVLDLLQGKQAAVNDPAMKQRAGQRQQLVDSLRAQYGPGAESSSIGQRALQQFDQQSDVMFQQNQQNTLGNMMGIATTKTGGVGFGQLMGAAQGYGSYQDRQLQAEGMGTQGILQGMSGEVQSAGTPYVGEMLRAGFQRQKYEQVSSDMRSIGRSWSTFGQSNKGGGGGAQGGGQVPLSGYGGTGDGAWNNNSFTNQSGWQPMSAQGNEYYRP